MTAARLTFGLVLATVAIAATACGGGSDSVPSGVVAVVDGAQISKREVDEFVARAKKGYEAQKQKFPKAGTPEYQNFQQRYLAGLVQIEEWRQAAKELDIEVTAKDIDAVESRFIKS